MQQIPVGIARLSGVSSKRPRRLFVVSAPSGCGKTTLCSRLLRAMPLLERSVSVTTRSPRRGEVHGKDYWFCSEKVFLARIARQEFLEWATVFGAYYGTLRRTVQRSLHAGRDVLLSIDVQGAAQIRKRVPTSVSIFIVPPSLQTLKARLESRGLDSVEAIARRLTIARQELAEAKRYDYVVVNDQLQEADHALRAIVAAERMRVLESAGDRRSGA